MKKEKPYELSPLLDDQINYNFSNLSEKRKMYELSPSHDDQINQNFTNSSEIHIKHQLSLPLEGSSHGNPKVTEVFRLVNKNRKFNI